jgi:hypothetical protein
MLLSSGNGDSYLQNEGVAMSRIEKDNEDPSIDKELFNWETEKIKHGGQLKDHRKITHATHSGVSSKIAKAVSISRKSVRHVREVLHRTLVVADLNVSDADKEIHVFNEEKTLSTNLVKSLGNVSAFASHHAFYVDLTNFLFAANNCLSEKRAAVHKLIFDTISARQEKVEFHTRTFFENWDVYIKNAVQFGLVLRKSSDILCMAETNFSSNITTDGGWMKDGLLWESSKPFLVFVKSCCNSGLIYLASSVDLSPVTLETLKTRAEPEIMFDDSDPELVSLSYYYEKFENWYKTFPVDYDASYAALGLRSVLEVFASLSMVLWDPFGQGSGVFLPMGPRSIEDGEVCFCDL